MAIEKVVAWFDAHPLAAYCVDSADALLWRPLTKAVERHTEREELRFRIRACGGRAPWYESTTALRRRLDRLARTGEV